MQSWTYSINHLAILLKKYQRYLIVKNRSKNARDVRLMPEEMTRDITGKLVFANFHKMEAGTGNVLLAHVLHHQPILDTLVG